MYLPVPQSRQWIIRKLSAAYLKIMAMGRAIVVDEVEKALSPDQRFYIFRRVSQCCQNRGSLFYQDIFGNIMKNIKEHYGERWKLRDRRRTNWNYLGIWRMLQGDGK